MISSKIVIEPFSGDQAVADAVAELHLAIRLRQKEDGENDFITTNLYDSQTDLKGMGSYYVESGGNFFIAYDSNTREIVGFIGLKKVGDSEGQIKRMAVLPAYRRQGIGTHLSQTAINWAREAGFKKLHLYTGDGERAMRLYKGVGFTLEGYRPGRHDYLMTMDLV